MTEARPIRVGTRGSPLALVQTRWFIGLLTQAHPGLAAVEQIIATTGDRVQDRRLAEIGGKGLFAKEIHEALSDRRIDCAVHSLKDLETELPAGIVLACTLVREDPGDALILGPDCAAPDRAAPFDCLPRGATIGTSSVRRQAQLLHARPDLAIGPMRGNVRTRLDKLAAGDCAATLLALAGLKRLDMADRASLVLPPELMLPASCQGIVGVTARADATDLLAWLAAIQDGPSRAAADAERAMLAQLDGSCRTPIGAHASLAPDGMLRLIGLVARADGTFLLRRASEGPRSDAAKIGAELGASLRADSPRDLFA